MLPLNNSWNKQRFLIYKHDVGKIYPTFVADVITCFSY
jgi:hypothetical protein